MQGMETLSSNIPCAATSQSIFLFRKSSGTAPCSRSSHSSLFCIGLRWNFRNVGLRPCTRVGREDGADEQNDFSSENEITSRGFVGRLLERALAAFVNSQLESCGELKVAVAGKNEELLTGQLRDVQIHARKAIYKGICMSTVHLRASAIKLTFPSKRILQEPFYVSMSIFIKEEDLVFSLASPLLQELLLSLLPQYLTEQGQHSGFSARIEEGFLLFLTKPFHGTSMSSYDKYGSSREEELTFAVHVEVEDDGQSLHVRCGSRGHDKDFVQKFRVGPEVCIRKLEIHQSNILLMGTFLVQP